MSKNQLLVREWVVFLMSVGVISTLFTSVPKVPRTLSCEGLEKELSCISVEVKGLVEFPGVYKIAPGVTVKEILLKARPHLNSDKHEVYLKKVLLDSSSVEIFEKKDKKKRAKKQPFR